MGKSCPFCPPPHGHQEGWLCGQRIQGSHGPVGNADEQEDKGDQRVEHSGHHLSHSPAGSEHCPPAGPRPHLCPRACSTPGLGTPRSSLRERKSMNLAQGPLEEVSLREAPWTVSGKVRSGSPQSGVLTNLAGRSWWGQAAASPPAWVPTVPPTHHHHGNSDCQDSPSRGTASC